MKKKLAFLFLNIAVCAPLWAAPAAPFKPGSWESWSAADPVRQKAGQLRKTEPQAAAALLEEELNKVTDPNVAADLFTLLGDIYVADVKEPQKAVALFERALPIFQKPEYKVPAYHWMTMIAAKANALAALKKGAEAEALIKENWPLLLQSNASDNAYNQRAARDTLRAYSAALEAQGKGEQFTGILSQFLRYSPQFLNLQSGDAGSWLLSELTARLQKEGKTAEALGWGKLVYQLAPFDKKEIERSTQTLNKLWAAQDDFAAVGLFTKAQSDAAVKNPLISLKTPPLTDEAKAILQKQVAELEGRNVVELNPARSRDIVKAYVTLGTPDDLKNAMKTAVKLLKERPDLQDGSLLVCRVFKAADCNLIRANAFLAYMNGEGQNPVTEFLK